MRKIDDVLGEYQFGFRRGRGTMKATGMLRTSERTFVISEELCAYFIEWQKRFDRVKWTKCLQILKGNGTVWPETRLISQLYMDQSVKGYLYERQT